MLGQHIAHQAFAPVSPFRARHTPDPVFHIIMHQFRQIQPLIMLYLRDRHMNGHRDTNLCQLLADDDLAEIIPRHQSVPQDLIIQLRHISDELFFRQQFLTDRQKIPAAADIQIGISPAVPYDLEMALHIRRRHIHLDQFRIRLVSRAGLFSGHFQEILHILTVVFHCRKTTVDRTIHRVRPV